MNIDEKILRIKEVIILLRKKLVRLELERASYEHEAPAEVWQEFANASHELDKAEEEIREISLMLLNDLEKTRSDIVASLNEYNLIRQQMFKIEELFLTNIVRPGYQLKLATQQRDELEQAYQRLLSGIQCEEFASQQELESEIRHVLSIDRTASEIREEVSDTEIHQDEDQLDFLWQSTADDVSGAISKVDLINEFKRVVLPKIHPDTSNTPVETFITVYEALKKEDEVLMEGYIVMYQEDEEPLHESDPIQTIDEITKIQNRYLRVLVLIKRRIYRLQKELTKAEQENPELLQETMRRQRMEILSRIQSEAEKIIYWREKIEGLVKTYLDYHS
jgi:hypothetical protein